MGIFKRLVSSMTRNSIRYHVDLSVKNGEKEIFVLPGVTVDARWKRQAKRLVENDIKLVITDIRRVK